MISFFNVKKDANTNDSSIAKVTKKFKISGMHCISCAMNISDTLEEQEGIFDAEANYAKAELKVVFDEKKITHEKIEEVVKNLGYKIQE